MNRKRIILAVLLTVLSGSLIYAYLATPRLEKAPPREKGQRVQRAVKSAGPLESKTTQERIDFAFLIAEPQEFSRAKRNIFRFGGRGPIKKTPMVTAPVLETPPVVASESIQPLPVDVVAKALSQFTFLGFLEKAGKKTVFLSSDGNLFLAKSGERFGANREFLVVDIDDDILKVRHVGREGLVEIKLIEQKKLSASVSAPAHLKPAEKLPGQQRPGAFAPKRKVAYPAESQKRENPFKKITEMNNPTAKKKSKRLPTGLILEGDVNGTNQ